MEIEQNVLLEVAHQAGIAERYISNWGKEAIVSRKTIEYLLGVLGYDMQSKEALLHSAEKIHKQPILEPVLFGKDEQVIEVPLYLGSSARESEFQWYLDTEQGERYEGYLQSQIVRDEREDGGPLVFSLSTTLPIGYHTLSVLRKGRQTPYQTTLIVTPSSCFRQPELVQGKKLWGPSVQLYTLRSQQNWGIGDFGDLKQLVVKIAEMGANFVGLNPIHALFPASPESASPYSPSSRRWINILYIDVKAVPELSQCQVAQKQISSPAFQKRLNTARESEWVQYAAVAALKMEILPLLYDTFKSLHLDPLTERGQAFHDFVAKGGESLLSLAAFDAIHAELCEKDSDIWGWPVFPENYRRFHSSAVKDYIRDHEDRINFYLYMQWLADTQIQEVQRVAKAQGMTIGLYRDLAVGVAESGAEAWADQGNLLLDVSIGAPPDELGPLGQNWGLPPLNPQTLRHQAYEPFIQLLRANMKYCGALRIDHILGLLRLWWIPRGEKATQGAYLYYRVDELLAILALESHRHQCSVIGEDLGTVPDEIASLLADAGIHSYKVFFFETAKDGGYISPQHYTAQSMSALCTHDMPTLRGFWHCRDLTMGHEIGLYPDEKMLKPRFDARLHNKQAILDSIAWHGFLPDSVGRDAMTVPMDEALSEAMHLHMAAGASALMSIQLEDWLQMDNPVNIPGTVEEYPNWRRKLCEPLETLFTLPAVQRLAEHISVVRAEKSKVVKDCVKD
ncbi:4-alpha-glucanotransferase [Vibrio mangrovi]|uniref:4-alpha-glucanotransferase n=1 Tax=Vibrio mangrovi TaxID=474394 RepID=A0A1Y6IVS9_9VIBR|nr:4-alpha-glucanotransferase [Vibrio mangrovi]MDW6004992.1 4-alpha-glucanotransferase [Vibrio mangrovi]SMS01757.1 4-alpha-glucanotransferase [Vibrio mangrovi]